MKQVERGVGMFGEKGPSFILFSVDHFGAICAIGIVFFGLFIISHNQLQFNQKNFERILRFLY